jgi:hypothetical protein
LPGSVSYLVTVADAALTALSRHCHVGATHSARPAASPNRAAERRDRARRSAGRHRGAAAPTPAPDTGIPGRPLALLAGANTDRNPMAVLVSSMLGSYYNKAGPTVAELRAEFRGQRGSAVEEVVSRAVERGVVDPARLTPRIIDLPFDLFRNEMMMTLKPGPRPRPAPDRRRHLHPARRHATTSPLTRCSRGDWSMNWWCTPAGPAAGGGRS